MTPRSGDHLLAVVVVNRDRVDGTRSGGKLRVEFRVLGHLADENAVLDLLAPLEDGLARRFVRLEGVPLGDTLEHSDTGVLGVLDSHGQRLVRSR